jgi:hypothetical protein
MPAREVACSEDRQPVVVAGGDGRRVRQDLRTQERTAQNKARVYEEESEMVPVRALVYSRVSTDAQERDGTSLDTQERA